MAPEMSGRVDPAVQQVINSLERSRTSRSSPGAGYFAEAMNGLLEIMLADITGAGPSREELERLWDAVHRSAVEDPGEFRGFSVDAEIAALSVRVGDWAEAAWRRSVLEFLREHPRFASYGVPFTDDDMADIDGPLREAAEDVEPLPGHLIPDGIPASHWWWWAPSAHYAD